MDSFSIEKILDVLGAENIKQTGDDYMMCSCLHAPYSSAHPSGCDSRPSMKVHITEDGSPSRYSCFTCGNYGTIIELINKLSILHKRDYSQVAKFASDNDMEYYIPSFETLIEKHKKKVTFTATPIDVNPRFTNIRNSKLGMKYLHSRRITNETIDKAQLQWDEYEKRVVFPVIGLDKILYGYTSRAAVPDKYFPKRKCLKTKQWDFGNKLSESDSYEPFYMENNRRVVISYEKIRDYKGIKKQQHIIGMHLWTNDKPVFIVEGLFGYIHLLSIGAYKYFNIGATMGAFMSDYQIERLRIFNKPVFLLYDNDSAGRIALFGDEKKLGIISRLEHKIPLFLPKWTMCNKDLTLKIENFIFENEINVIDNKVYKGYTKIAGKWYKADPDRLTIDDIRDMKLKAEMI